MMSWIELNSNSNDLSEWLSVKNEYCCPDKNTERFIKNYTKRGNVWLYKDGKYTVILATKYIIKYKKIKISFGAATGYTNIDETKEAVGIACKKIKEILVEYECNGFSIIGDDWLTQKANAWFDVLEEMLLDNRIRLTNEGRVWNYELI